MIKYDLNQQDTTFGGEVVEKGAVYLTGHAIPQAGGCWLLNLKTWVQTQMTSSEIHG
jgi:hypothetical protein